MVNLLFKLAKLILNQEHSKFSSNVDGSAEKQETYHLVNTKIKEQEKSAPAIGGPGSPSKMPHRLSKIVFMRRTVHVAI